MQVKPYQLGVLGNPIYHSLSPWVHHTFAEHCGVGVNYQKFLVPLDGFDEMINTLQNQGYQGVNVTAPFKLAAYKIATRYSESANMAMAANTLLFHSDGTVEADNTDGLGLINDININLNYTLKDKRILLLGAGGAAYGILLQLIKQLPAEIVLLNRTKAKAVALYDHFGQPTRVTIANSEKVGQEPFDVILDATSAWESMPFLLDGIDLAPNSLCYDLKYAAEPTPFLQWAKQQNSDYCKDGLGMLIEQAAIAFQRWTGVMPQTQSVITLARAII